MNRSVLRQQTAILLTLCLFVLPDHAEAQSSNGLPPRVACVTCWRPSLHTSWQWQLSGRVETKIRANVYDIDMFATSAKQIALLHRLGRKVVCYIDAGSWERYRPDASKYPRALLGKTLQGWPAERWLDIMRISQLAPLIRHRLRLCKQKGFNSVEFDNVDAYQNNSGFPLTARDQLRFNIFLANLAHRNGLSVALKNDTDQVKELLHYFDWSLDEQCFQYRECQSLLPFIRAGKPVFEVEYYLARSRYCGKARAYGFNAMRKHLALGAWVRRC